VTCVIEKMANCDKTTDHTATLRILQMLLSTRSEASMLRDTDEGGSQLSRLIDDTCGEFFGGRRKLECPTNVESFDVMNGLLAVLRECLLAHRWAAALRVLTTVVHRTPKHYGRTVLHCILEICTQMSLPVPDSLLLRLKTYAELTEHEVAVESFMARLVSGLPLTACRAALAPLPRRRFVPGRDDRRHRVLVRAYDGLASYAQYLHARQIRDSATEFQTELCDETSILAKSSARDALEKWEGLVDVPGVWDVFVVKQVQ